MLTALLDVVLPTFAVAAVGFFYAGRRPFPIAAFTDLIIHLAGACLVFDALSGAERFDAATLRVPLSAALLVVGGVGVGFVARRVVPSLARLPMGAVVLPAAFMNAGNLGLPLSGLAFGDEGLRIAMLFFVTFSALQYSLGIALVAGRQGAQEVFRVPLVYAAVLGIAVNQLGLTIPKAIAIPIELLGDTVIPIMLLSLGARMRSLVVGSAANRHLWPVILLPVLRSGGGALVALTVNALLGNTGLIEKITLLAGILPPAVMNFALVEKYGGSEEAPATVSAAIAVGTLFAVLYLPVAIGGLMAL